MASLDIAEGHPVIWDKSRLNRGHILVVDNDPQIRRVMRMALIAEGFELSDARTGYEALDMIGAQRYDLVVLDINMPGLSGLETCRAIRARSDVPIIMLTVRSAEKDKTAAFEMGADDYVTKPFSLPELLARIRAGLRRGAQQQEQPVARLHLGDAVVDFQAREVRSKGRTERLTPKEYDLLSYLAAHPNKTIPHGQLLRVVWGSDSGEREYLRVFINRLRRKIERSADEPEYLLTDPWVGYRLKLPE
jgi:two-component system KDP operon response regulator KdpE